MPDDPNAVDPSGGYGFGGLGGMAQPGMIPPWMAQAYAADPRRMLVQSIMQMGQQSLQQPTYSPWSALAKALTIGVGGASAAKLADQYSTGVDFNQTANSADSILGEGNAVSKLLRSPDMQSKWTGMQAYPAAVAGRVKPSLQKSGEQLLAPDTGQTLVASTAAQSPEGKLLADINRTPAEQRTPLQAALWKQAQDHGVTYGPDGAAVFPGAAKAMGTVAGATAAGTAAGTQPYEQQNAFYKQSITPEQIRSGSLAGTPGQLGVDLPRPMGVPLSGPGQGGPIQPGPQTGAKPGGVYNSPETAETSKALADETATSRVAADAARQQRAVFGEMLAASKGATLGSQSEQRGALVNFLNTYVPGDHPGWAEHATQNQVFDKLSTLVAGQATKQLDQSANAALETMRKSFPNRDMTPQALQQMIGQLSGVQDYIIAKDLARHAYINGDPTAGTPGKGTAQGFLQSDWVKSNPPESFMQAGKVAATPVSTIAPAPAIEHLKANPSLTREFDAKYGAGAAARVLSQ